MNPDVVKKEMRPLYLRQYEAIRSSRDIIVYKMKVNYSADSVLRI